MVLQESGRAISGHCFADISQLRALGYEPANQFEDGLEELVRWLSAQTVEEAFPMRTRNCSGEVWQLDSRSTSHRQAICQVFRLGS